MTGQAKQAAWVATVEIMVPYSDANGNPVESFDAACDFISETLSGSQLQDWMYVHQPVLVHTQHPYEEGMWY